MSKGERGYTLAEVMISMLLMAVVVGAAFKMAITSQGSTGIADRRIVANQYGRHLSEVLATYTLPPTIASGLDPTQLQGPNQIATTAPSMAQWSLNGLIGDDGHTAVVDSMGGWALAPGIHTVSNFLPAWFADPPYNAIISYCIPPAGGPGLCGAANSYGVSGGTVSLANINVTWTDP
jgi:prepilin-type N-terminal cleavage/methylation domain-containing protein